MKTKLLLCFFSLLFISQYAFCTPLLPVDFEYVVDGDTIHVNTNKSSYRVRLYRIGCFEVDHYGRMIAEPYITDFLFFKTNLSKYMNKSGLCSTYVWKGMKTKN